MFVFDLSNVLVRLKEMLLSPSEKTHFFFTCSKTHNLNVCFCYVCPPLTFDTIAFGTGEVCGGYKNFHRLLDILSLQSHIAFVVFTICVEKIL